MVSPGLTVGDRIIIRGGHWGTVRYLGPVPGQTGDWSGVEWDEESRGKHDGTAAGVRLFSCRRPGTPATLVRVAKLKESLMESISLAQAIEQRYCHDDDGTKEHLVGDAAVRGIVAAPAGGVLVVGREDLLAVAADLPSLAHASLSGMPVDLRDSPDDVATLVPALQSLDLSCTAVRAWTTARRALSGLLHLRSLDLSSTALRFETGADAIPSGLETLDTLILNGTGCSWADAVALTSSLPALRTLCLCDNDIAGLDVQGAGLSCDCKGNPAAAVVKPNGAMTGLQHLDLSGNRLRSWEEVGQLSALLPALEVLNLSGCPLQDCNGDATTRSGDGSRNEAAMTNGDGCRDDQKDNPALHFPELHTLILAGCPVGSWAQVQGLAALRQLSNLRLSATPVWEGAGQDARAETIARLPGLRVLNGSDVSAAERHDAELWYLRRVTDELARVGAARAQVLASHPRFEELEKQYGPLATVPIGAPASSQLLEVVLVHGDRTLPKRLPGSLTVQRLKTLIERLLGVPADAQSIILAEDGGFLEDISSLDTHHLSMFSILPGTRVEVTQRDPNEAGEKLASQGPGVQDLERRMAAQGEQLQALHAAQQHIFSGAPRSGQR